jgi:hypothetical protein
MDFTTDFIQDNARVTRRRTPAFLEQRALDGSGLPRTGNVGEYMLVSPAGHERSVSEQSVGHGFFKVS